MVFTHTHTHTPFVCVLQTLLCWSGNSYFSLSPSTIGQYDSSWFDVHVLCAAVCIESLQLYVNNVALHAVTCSKPQECAERHTFSIRLNNTLLRTGVPLTLQADS